MQKLRDKNISVEVQCVVNRFNLSSVLDLVEVAKNVGAKMLKFVFVNPIGRAKENYDELGIPHQEYVRTLEFLADVSEQFPGFVRLKTPPAVIPPHLYRRFGQEEAQREVWYGCGFPLMGVLPDGTVTICALTRSHEEIKFGHVLEDDLLTLWRRGKGWEMRQQYMETKLEGICGDCIFRDTCKGSCRAHAYDEYGSLTGPYLLCQQLADEGLFPSLYRTSVLESRCG